MVAQVLEPARQSRREGGESCRCQNEIRRMHEKGQAFRGVSAESGFCANTPLSGAEWRQSAAFIIIRHLISIL